VQVEDLDPDAEAAFAEHAAAQAVVPANATEDAPCTKENSDPAAPIQIDITSSPTVPATDVPSSTSADVKGEPAKEAAPKAGEVPAETQVAASLSRDPAMNLQFYKNFWGLQEQLQHPEKTMEKPESWSAFTSSLSQVLTLFLKYAAPDGGRQPWAPPEPTPLRHAPRARALGVQLEDPGFRQQFLTQVMMAFQALEQDGSSRRGDAGGLIARMSESVRSQFFALKRQCETVLEQTRQGYPALLRHVLEREAHWVSWKGHGCREFERESLEMLNGRVPPADTLGDNLTAPRPTKPHLQPYVSGLLRTLKDPQWKLPTPLKSDDQAASDSMRPRKMRKMSDAYCDRLIEEDKPENEIDEEYKAKKNKVFMWQCRRLFCQQYLRVYAQGGKDNRTDFMDYVRAVRGKPLPAAAPAAAAGAAGAGAGAGAAGAGASRKVSESPTVVDVDAISKSPPSQAAAGGSAAPKVVATSPGPGTATSSGSPAVPPAAQQATTVTNDPPATTAPAIQTISPPPGDTTTAAGDVAVASNVVSPACTTTQTGAPTGSAQTPADSTSAPAAVDSGPVSGAAPHAEVSPAHQGAKRDAAVLDRPAGEDHASAKKAKR